MKNTLHTPGPWIAEGWLGLTVNTQAEEGKATICAMPGGRKGASKEELQANARLIAAAPELLDLLALALPYVENALDDEAYKKASVQKLVDAIRQKIEAIDGAPYVFEDDARLIAAAHDLLAACERAIAALACADCPPIPDGACVRGILFKAIKKAKGK